VWQQTSPIPVQDALSVTGADNVPGVVGPTTGGTAAAGTGGTDGTAAVGTTDGTDGTAVAPVGAPAQPAAAVVTIPDLPDDADTATTISTLPATLLTDQADAGNESDGAAAIGTGRATATGNLTDDHVAQAASVKADGDPVVAQTALTLNAGIGAATSGANQATGNDSTNQATLQQTATGAGLVSNQGSARNRSDGTARIGGPVRPGAPVGPEAPGSAAGLPRTGGPVEELAVVGLLLLLVGSQLRRLGDGAAR
jgi:hypothetical protein